MKNYIFVFLAYFLAACNQPASQPTFTVCGKLNEYPAVVKAGYDGMELIVGDFFTPGEGEDVFFRNLLKLKYLNANIVSCMQFIPSRFKLTGPDVRPDEILAWAETTFRRSREAGIPYIVLGSGEARRVPDGFNMEVAMAQFIDLCKKMAPIAEKYNIILLVEPLGYIYSNFIYTLAEGMTVVKAVNHPNVQLLCDIYHMMLNDDPPEEIIKYGEYIRHCHIAEKVDRKAPGTAGDDFSPYFKALKQINYKGAISVEIDQYKDGQYMWNDINKELVKALKYMRNQYGR